MGNTSTVLEIYEAFGRGDVPAILNKFDDNVEWETRAPTPDMPWLQSRSGKGGIAPFFAALAPLKITRVEPHTFFENGDTVFVVIGFKATNKGKSYSFPNNRHLWQFNSAGKVTRFDHITDTARMIA